MLLPIKVLYTNFIAVVRTLHHYPIDDIDWLIKNYHIYHIAEWQKKNSETWLNLKMLWNVCSSIEIWSPLHTFHVQGKEQFIALVIKRIFRRIQIWSVITGKTALAGTTTASGRWILRYLWAAWRWHEISTLPISFHILHRVLS